MTTRPVERGRFGSGCSWRPSNEGNTTTKRRGVLIALNSPARWWRFPHRAALSRHGLDDLQAVEIDGAEGACIR
jgi:hypothetical protein